MWTYRTSALKHLYRGLYIFLEKVVQEILVRMDRIRLDRWIKVNSKDRDLLKKKTASLLSATRNVAEKIYSFEGHCKSELMNKKDWADVNSTYRIEPS